jgi:hypothetical protein
MARFPDVDIEQLNKTVSLEALAERAGVTLKRHGAHLFDCLDQTSNRLLRQRNRLTALIVAVSLPMIRHAKLSW